MATFLDIGLFQYFNFIFPILLVFAVLFALLHKTKILGTNLTINAIIAIALSLMTLLSSDLIALINFMAPWFVLVFVFLILLLLIYQTLGATEADFLSALKGEKTLLWAVLGIALVILAAGIASVWGAKVLPITQGELPEGAEAGEIDASSAYEKNLMATFFNPKILGIILVFLVAIFTIAFLSGG